MAAFWRNTVQGDQPHVSDLLALTSVTPPFKLKDESTLLQESHIGTIFSPVTLELITWAPKTGVDVHPLTEQFLGHVFFENVTQ